MVAVSWRKMYRRVTHVYSRHSMENLTTLTPVNMRIIFKRFASTIKPHSGKDSDLAAFLVSLDEEALPNILDSHLKGYQFPTESQPGDIKRLVYAFQATLSSQRQEDMGAYNEQTCFLFHLLLVATITGFTESLVSLHNASTAKEDEYAQLAGATRADDRLRYAQEVLQFGRLLRLIAYSKMLTLHLELLEAGNFLRTPSNTGSGHMRNSAPGDGGNEDEDDDNDVAEELGNSEKDKAVTLRRWIQLLVSYWVAAESLGKFSASQGTTGANITLIHVRGKLGRRGEPDRKVAPWDATIRRLASLPAAADSQHPFDAEAAIDSFVKRIQDPHLDDKRIKAFRLPEGCFVAPIGDVVFSGNIHCEVAIAMLLGYFARVKVRGPEELTELLEVLITIFINTRQTDFSYKVHTQA
jgi:hypothetical protein